MYTNLPAQVKDIMGGAGGGVAIVLTGYPLDTLKVRLQTAPPGQFTGFFDAFSKTLKNEGLFGFWKGAASPLVGVAARHGSLFFGYGHAVRYFRERDRLRPGELLPIYKVWISGAVAGFTASFVEGPVDLVKSKMQIQYKGRGGVRDTFRTAYDIVKSYGVRGIYQGLGATMIRNVPANSLYFAVYQYLRRKWTTERTLSDGRVVKYVSPLATLTAGGLGGIVYWTLCYPMDVNKSKMQTEPSDKSLRRFRNSIHCSLTILKENGWRGFWRGYLPCLIRAFPANGSGFVVYETVLQFLNDEY